MLQSSWTARIIVVWSVLALVAGVLVWRFVTDSEIRDRVDGLLTRRFLVDGASMEPTFCDGDVITFDKYDGSLERWQLIIFDFHLDPARTFMKRVVGLPGETLEVREGTVYVDGEPVEGDVYAKQPANYVVEPLLVPRARFFVLGDNRRNSSDSHAWSAQVAPELRSEGATVPADLIRGELPAQFGGCGE
jgi:signal peptidase I